MPTRPRPNVEILVAAGLFVTFLVAATLFTRGGQDRVDLDSVSSENYASSGSRALFTLLGEFHLPVDRLTTNWGGLASDDRALIVMEPFDPERLPSEPEVKAVDRWVRDGGTLVYFVGKPARPTDPNDPLTGDVAVVNAGRVGGVLERIRPLTQGAATAGVREIAVSSPVRLVAPPKAGYRTLFRDRAGAVALTKTAGAGRVVLIADAVAATNSSIREADNAQLLVNLVASFPTRRSGAILFDEYHHGIGSEVSAPREGGGGLFTLLPVPVRFAIWQFVLVGLFLIWNGNRRFGAAIADRPTANRPPTDYVTSMARLYRRAEAGDIAVGALYASLIHELTRRLDTAPNAGVDEVARRAAKRYNLDNADVTNTLQRAASAAHGERMNEATALDLARKLELLRRNCDLVGI